MPTEAQLESTQESQAGRPKHFFARLVGVYFSPRETFREIGMSPQVLVPIVALIIVGVLTGWYLSSSIDMESVIASQMEQAVAQGRISQEQAAQQTAIVSKYAGAQLLVGIPLASIIMVLVIAAGFKLISSLIGAGNRFKALLAVTLYTMLAVSIVQSALTVLILTIKGTAEVDASNINSLVASNLGAILAGVMGDDALPGFLMRLARFIDLFAAWIIALLAVGYTAVSRRLKLSKAALWLVSAYAVIAVIIDAISSPFGG